MRLAGGRCLLAFPADFESAFVPLTTIAADPGELHHRIFDLLFNDRRRFVKILIVDNPEFKERVIDAVLGTDRNCVLILHKRFNIVQSQKIFDGVQNDDIVVSIDGLHGNYPFTRRDSQA